jgi:transcriptional regulator with XRE-family HTH domain
MQTYKEILDFMLKRSGLTLEEVAEQCRQHGVEMSASYLSKLRLGHRPPPENHISRAIAKVCGHGHENLIDAANFEKTPVSVSQQLSMISTALNSIIQPVIDHILEDDTALELLFKPRGISPTPAEARALLSQMSLTDQFGLLKENGIDFNLSFIKRPETLERAPFSISANIHSSQLHPKKEAALLANVILNSFPDDTLPVSLNDYIIKPQMIIGEEPTAALLPPTIRRVTVYPTESATPEYKGPRLPAFDFYLPVDSPAECGVVASGPNMTGGSVEEGDILFIDHCQEYANGNLVIAVINDRETLAKYILASEKVAILQPMNPALPPLILDGETEVQIFGVVRAMHRKL